MKYAEKGKGYLRDVVKRGKIISYIQRMEEGRLPKQVMKWSPPGRRKRGRPKLTWLEGIRGLMGEKGLVEEDWNDRDEWRNGERRYYKCSMGAGRCGNVVQTAK
jgi:hypothetical protein